VTEAQPLHFAPSDEDLAQCVRCGLCLQHCPTFVQTGLETEGPRGRLYLMKALAEGIIEPTPNVVGHLDQCLQCRNCEAVCPSGVPYGRIMERTRAQILTGESAPREWRMRSAFLRRIVASPTSLSAFASALRLYDASGLRSIAERLPFVGERALLAPSMRGKPFRDTGTLASPPNARQRVAILTGCIMAHAYGRVHRATVRVLARNGCEVVAPPQGCCGALHAHNGDLPKAMGLARANIDTFLDTRVDAIVVNSAGCGAAMKEYGELLAGDDEYREKAVQFSAIVKDVNEFLVGLPFDPPKARLERTVTYQDSCHLAHAQRISEAPRAIMRAIEGLDLIEMEHADRCCGSAGVYALTQPEMSLDLLDDKMAHVTATSAQIIATANPGCMAQLEAGVRRTKQDSRVVHVVELLAKAYSSERSS